VVVEEEIIITSANKKITLGKKYYQDTIERSDLYE